MAVMLDTCVVVDALEAALDPTTADNQLRAALHVIENADGIVLSSLTILELELGYDGQTREVIARWGDKVVRTEVVDAAIASRAAALLKMSQRAPDVCKRCLGVVPPTACAHCGGQATKQRKLNDAMIVATAERRADVKCVYTTDGGMTHLGQFANVDVLEPPPAPSENLALFPPTPIHRAKKSKIKR